MATEKIKILIIGAGEAGELLSGDILEKPETPFQVVGFVDDDPTKQNLAINGLPVVGKLHDLADIIKKYRIEEIFIALPSERGKLIRQIIENTIGLDVTYKILPRLSEVLLQDFDKDYLKYVRKVKAEDLLGGEILKADQKEISHFAKDEIVMITGAAGSIGSELSRQIAAHGARKIIFYDWWENGMFELDSQLIEAHPTSDFEFYIGDIKDRQKINQIMAKFKPTTVFHAAAYKHVPLMEHNAPEAIKNNLIGTKTVGEAAIKNKVKKFILVSTDKAVNPTNVMGATKRAAEQIIHILAESQPDTTFCTVRFGNVINSNGSAIPVFVKQIEQGGPVTVTHKDVTRYFMTIPEAVHLILQSWVMGKNNDLFVLDMGESVKIYNLAKLLIALDGYIPEKDIKIKIIGLRPGEKLFEEILVNEEETSATAVKKIFRTKNYLNFDRLAFITDLNLIFEMVEEDAFDIVALKTQLEKMVPTYKPNRH